MDIFLTTKLLLLDSLLQEVVDFPPLLRATLPERQPEFQELHLPSSVLEAPRECSQALEAQLTSDPLPQLQLLSDTPLEAPLDRDKFSGVLCG